MAGGLAKTEWTIFWTVAQRVVPALGDCERSQAATFKMAVQAALTTRPPAIVAQFSKFLKLLNILPVIRYGHCFTSLSEVQQDAVISWLESAPIGLLRRGTWGVKTIIFMGYFGQPAVGRSLGYGAVFNGNAVLDVHAEGER